MIIRVEGVLKALRNFEQLPAKMQFKQLRIALNAAGGVIRDRAKAIAPRDSGLLRRSLDVKAKIPNESFNPKHWGKPEYVVIGANRRFSGAVTATSSGKTRVLATRKSIVKAAFNRATIVRRRPSRYIHLVEHDHAKRGGAGTVMGMPFLDTAVRTEGQVAQLKMIRKLEQGLYQEAARLYAGT